MLACCTVTVGAEEEVITSEVAGEPAAADIGDTKPELGNAASMFVADDSGLVEEDMGGAEVLYCPGACGRKQSEGQQYCCHSCRLNPGLGFHDISCGKAEWDDGVVREVCPKGSKCRNRDQAHLEALAHPLDKDYAIACFKGGIAGESLCCKVLFDWADADASGKLSRQELEASLVAVSKICPSVLPELSEESWKSLDEDGNGVVNFGEFAAWAAPRVGLPVGMEKIFWKSVMDRDTQEACPCHILNCPCEHFEMKPTDPDKCKICKHSKQHHVSKRSMIAGQVPVPPYWDSSGAEAEEKNLFSLAQGAHDEFQELMKKCHVNKWTRDRKKHNPGDDRVPYGYKVVSVKRNENIPNWTEYACRRASLQSRTLEQGSEINRYNDVKSAVAFREVAGAKADRLLHELNEWYLFHGTNPEIAQKICNSDFRVSCAGGNTGTLYGKGLYFAESITKADEYAKPDKLGNFAVLLCRVLGGNVRYTDEVTPDPEALVKDCIQGPYDCVLGDREKARGTFREFVIFDSEDVYPEYIIEYTRMYTAEGAGPAPTLAGPTPAVAASLEVSKVGQLICIMEEAKAKHGEENQEVAAAMVNLGNAYLAEKNFATAIELLEKAVAIKERTSGPDSPSLAVALSSLGHCYASLGQLQRQVDVLTRSLQIREKDKGPDHPELAATLGNLGVAHRKMGMPGKALEFLSRGLSIKEAAYGADSPEVALTLGNCAQCHGDMGDKQKQRQLLTRALGVFEKTRGPDHPHTQLARNALAQVG